MKVTTITLTLCLLILSSCRLGRMAQFFLSENHQRPKFHTGVIDTSDEPFQFTKGSPALQSRVENAIYTPPDYQNKKKKSFQLGDYLDNESKTTALLVIRRDTIVYEQYFEGYDSSSILPSFSVAKSFTSSLVGFAAQDGLITSVQDPVTKYLPQLRSLDPRWQQLTIEHLLNMRSGLDFNENNYVNPFSSIADLYLSKNVLKVVERAKFAHQPGTVDYYSSLDTEILGLILEKVTGKPMSGYLEEKLWKPLGMETPATWHRDSKKNNHTKAFCCLQVCARDYAKFGRLYLNGGHWNGKQILDPEWVARSVQPDLTNGCYQYQWYSGNKNYRYIKNEEGKYEVQTFPDSLSAVAAIEKPESEYARKSRSNPSKWLIRTCGPNFYALGIFGQEIYVNPTKELIFVRLGKRWDVSNHRIFRVIEKALEE